VTKDNMDAIRLLRKVVEQQDSDVLRELMKVFLDMLMSAEADTICGAAYGERSDERVNRRNGYRKREFDTRVGTIPLAVPKLREGSYYPDWLLENRRRAEQSARGRDRRVPCAGSLDQESRRARQDARHRRHLALAGLTSGEVARRGGRRLPQPPPRRRRLSLPHGSTRFRYACARVVAS